MYLAPDSDELSIVEAAGKFLADNTPAARLHGDGGPDMSPSLRAMLGEFGWFALAVPEAAGGSGLSAVEHALFFRELGRNVGPVDALAQALAAQVAQDEALRAGVLAGETGVALAVRDGASLRILGSADATYALLAEPERASLLQIDGAKAKQIPSLDPAASIRLIDASVEAVAKAEGPDVWRLGQAGAAAMLVGLAEAALDLIVEYAKVRETFGRPIGSYQAVRHPCADMATRVEAARAQLYYAATALKEGRDEASVHLNAAKHLANQAGVANADACIQLHGGIGVTDEHDAHLILKHALLLTRVFGSKRWLLGQLLHAKAEA
jgi:alkylation response protein AidB-like acyl-CoA dehydrogenase